MIAKSFFDSNNLVDQRPFGSWKSFIVHGNDVLGKIGNLLYVSIYGVDFYTDSSSIYESIKSIAAAGGNAIFAPTGGSLYHLVNKKQEFFDLVSKGFFAIEAINGVRQDELMFVLPDLRHFITFDIDSFSSILGNIFGICSFLRINSADVGVHSSTLLDTQSGCIHMILGQTTAGKSSCAYLIEQMSEKRYVVISDDWSEINVEKNIAMPFISFLGEPRNEMAKKYLSENNEFQRIKLSGDKSWYIRKSAQKTGWRDIGLIFQLDVKSRIKNEIYIFRRNNTHIPFMNVNLERDFSAQEDLQEKYLTQKKVIRKLFELLKKYENLAKWKNYYCIDAGTGNMQLVANNIYEILKMQ